MPRKRTQQENKQNNIALGILFSAAIIFLIGISLFGKVVSLFQKGKFDNSYPFSVKIENNQRKQFIYLSPKENKISILNINNLKDDVSTIPQDSQLISSTEISSSNLSTFFKDLIEDKKMKTDLTSVDKARIYLFVKSISQENILTQSINSILDQKSDKIIYDIFSDEQIISEDLRIEVINATGVYGVGNKLAKMLSNMGGNVIFVKTAEDTGVNSSVLYSGNKGYTVSRLERLLGFKASVNKEKSISDIVIILGKDAVKFIN